MVGVHKVGGVLAYHTAAGLKNWTSGLGKTFPPAAHTQVRTHRCSRRHSHRHRDQLECHSSAHSPCWECNFPVRPRALNSCQDRWEPGQRWAKLVGNYTKFNLIFFCWWHCLKFCGTHIWTPANGVRELATCCRRACPANCSRAFVCAPYRWPGPKGRRPRWVAAATWLIIIHWKIADRLSADPLALICDFVMKASDGGGDNLFLSARQKV